MIWIIIPVFNRWAFTEKCLNSLLKQSYKDFVITIVDHGSTDNTYYHIKNDYPTVNLVSGNSSMWWTEATNLGIQSVLGKVKKDDFILTLNNDLEVDTDYLSCLICASNKFKDSIIGSVSVDIISRTTVHFAGTIWDSKTAKYRPSAPKNTSLHDLKITHKFIQSDLLPGRGILIPVNVFKKIGLYDTDMFPHYMADEDFSLRAKKNGYQLVVPTTCIVYSHVQETGLKEQHKSLNYFIKHFTSIKSPLNIKYRWNWARKHSTIFPPIYFAIDLFRVLKGLILK